MMILQSSFFQLEIDPEQRSWSLSSMPDAFVHLANARWNATYRLGPSARQHFELTGLDDRRVEGQGPERIESPQDELEQISLSYPPDANGICLEARFALSEQRPLMLWMLRLQNRGNAPVFIDRLELANVGGRPGSSLRVHPQPGDLAFYSNGWQSWARSAVYGVKDRQARSRLGPLQSTVIYNRGTPLPKQKGHFSSDFYGILGDRTHRTGIQVGFLSQLQHFGSLEVDLQHGPELCLWANGDGVRLDPGQAMETDWAVITPLNLDDPDPQKEYLEAVARQHGLEQSAPAVIPVGWCSWYHFYEKVTAVEIERNLRTIAAQQPSLPLSLVQIDDGFEAHPGDWFAFKPTFPAGVALLAEQIRDNGFTPGLWLAPFIVSPRAHLIHEHPEYLLRNHSGRPVNAGFIWNAFTTALDLTHPGALDYACRVVDTAAHAWGFPYLKLDFLYAGALAGRHCDPTRTRAQILRMGLEALRRAAGAETYLLGCGAPLGSSLGIFEAMRIGEDVSGEWHPQYHGVEWFFRDEPHFPSVRNAIQNILARAPLHNRWWVNDPDCLLVRPETNLSLAEVQSLATAIALTGGSLLISDDLPALPPERRKIVEALLPLIGKRPRLIDWFDGEHPERLRLDLDGPAGSWRVIALFNWRDAACDQTIQLTDFDLEPGNYWVRSFWDRQVYTLDEQGLQLMGMPAHGVALLAIRPQMPGNPVFVGSDLHVSQGMEITGWEDLPGRVRLRLELPRRIKGQIELALPGQPCQATLNGQPATFSSSGQGRFYIAVEFDRQGEIEIEYS